MFRTVYNKFFFLANPDLPMGLCYSGYICWKTEKLQNHSKLRTSFQRLTAATRTVQKKSHSVSFLLAILSKGWRGGEGKLGETDKSACLFYAVFYYPSLK